MLTDKDVPFWTDKTEEGLRAWWKQMAAAGLIFHPDDSPETIVTVKSGERVFSASACLKLKGLIAEMFLLYGETVYDTGHEVLMEFLGWVAGPSGDFIRAPSSQNGV